MRLSFTPAGGYLLVVVVAIAVLALWRWGRDDRAPATRGGAC